MSGKSWRLQKRRTGIPGLDELTRGGLPAGQATLIIGGAGSGKTVLTLQLIAAAIADGGSGVFISFEESPEQIRQNVASFSWGSALNESDRFVLIDARIPAGADQAGDFDISGLLTVVESRAANVEQPWVVIDGIDHLLQFLSSPIKALHQIQQINARCEEMGWPLLLTGKTSGDGFVGGYLQGLEFILPTVLMLKDSVIGRRLHRFIRIAKYRGSGHVGDEVPLIINKDGVNIPAYSKSIEPVQETSTARVSTGIVRLDELLDGGLYRGSNLLISGRPGTAKSTLSASIAKASIDRGERALYISFDELEPTFVRNFQSVGIDLRPGIESGQLVFQHRLASHGSMTEQLLDLRNRIESFRPACLLIDPVSSLLKSGPKEDERAVLEQFVEFTRRLGITSVLTSLTAHGDPEGETSSAYVSTIADAWIVLDYNMRAGERNRSLSIVKSRGTPHSNQQREVIMSEHGVDLVDVYEFGSEVLMGTARAEKEGEEHEAIQRREVESAQRRLDLERRIDRAVNEVERLKADLELERSAKEKLAQTRISYTERIKKMRQSEPGRNRLEDKQ